MKKTIIIGIAGAALGLFVATPKANATINLILNPTFSTGDFTDWSTTGSTGSVVSASQPTFSNAAQFGNTVDTLSQTVTTVPGDLYDVSFFLEITNFKGPEDNSFDASFGGQTLTVLPDVLIPNYVQLVGTVQATGTSSTFDFTGTNANGDTFVSDVDVSEDDSVVPEPSTVSVMSLAGLGLVGLILFRRKQAALKS